MTYYAWSPIPTDHNEFGQPTKRIEVGDTVTADKVGVSKEEFEYLIEAGAVREEKYPEDLAPNQSPNELERQQRREMLLGNLSPEAREELMEQIEEARTDPETEEAVSSDKGEPGQ